MPTLTEAELIEVGRALLTAAKIPAQEIDPVALHLADANMVGHDSHGVMRLVQYLQMVDDGFVKPGAPVERVVDGPAFCVLDGHFNLGQVIAGEGCIVTAGGIDTHIHFICPQQIEHAIAAGVTTL